MDKRREKSPSWLCPPGSRAPVPSSSCGEGWGSPPVPTSPLLGLTQALTQPLSLVLYSQRL